MRRLIAVAAAIAVVAVIAVAVTDDQPDINPVFAAVPDELGVYHRQAKESWPTMARKIAPGISAAQAVSFADYLQRANGLPRLRPGLIVFYALDEVPVPEVPPSTTTTHPGPSTSTMMTTSPSSVSPSSSPLPPTSTSTTAAPSTSAPASTTVPGSPTFLLDFAQASDVDQLHLETHHRNHWFMTHGHPGCCDHDYGATWSGDHNAMCQGPTTQRTVHSSTDDDNPHMLDGEAFWWCAPSGPDSGHFMTSMGDIDGYSIVALSPVQVFTAASQVCWDVNLTDLGIRKWVEAHLVPVDVFNRNDGRLAYVNPIRETVDDTSLPYEAGIVSVSLMFHEPRLYVGRNERAAMPAFKVADKAKRWKHCITDNHDGTLTMEQETASGVRSRTAAGHFPAAFKFIITDHSYTPLKDGPIAGFTWHYDNLEVS